MRKSRFSKEDKVRILKDKEESHLTIEEICVKHGISSPTYHNWKRELSVELYDYKSNKGPGDLRTENTILRNLYINLSEHNYQLAKFLSK